MHHPTDRIIHTTAFGTPVVEHCLEREIAQRLLKDLKLVYNKNAFEYWKICQRVLN